MPQRRHLTQNKRQRALGYLLAGQTERQVATEFNVNQSVIGRLWQLYPDTGDIQRRPGQGRLRVTTDAQDRRLSLMARHRRFDPTVTHGRDFEQTYGYRISAQTVRNRLGLNIFITNQFIQYNTNFNHTNIRIRTEARAYQVLLLKEEQTSCCEPAS